MRTVNPLALAKVDGRYPTTAPFHPSKAYPEYDGPTAEDNCAFEGVRLALRLAGLDSARFGSSDWNPLGDLIKPGETVLIKPNLVKESHPRDPHGWRYVLTHGSVIRATVEYAFKAVGQTGRVLVADAPQTDSSFDAICAILGLREVQSYFQQRGFRLELLDLRKEEWGAVDGVITRRRTLSGDPAGYVALDLGSASEFVGHKGENEYYGADYDRETVNSHHRQGRHEYLISGSVIAADVIISVPKLKTHKKTGLTVTLKNLVGVNGDKNWLPHHTEGKQANDERPPTSGGRTERRAVQFLQQMTLRLPVVGSLVHRIARRAGRRVFGDTEEVIRSGNWFGNDTTWRMCLDLNKCVLYGNPDGSLRPGTTEGRKRHFSLVDGLIAGDGNGPMNPDPVPCGLVIFGTDAPSVDALAAWVMGFDLDRLALIRQAFRCRTLALTDLTIGEIAVRVAEAADPIPLTNIGAPYVHRFKPHFGWLGQVERRRPDVS